MKYIKPFLEKKIDKLDITYEFQSAIDIIDGEYKFHIDEVTNKIVFQLHQKILTDDDSKGLENYIRREKIKLSLLEDVNHIIERLISDGYKVSYSYKEDEFKISIFETTEIVKISDVFECLFDPLNDNYHHLQIDEHKLILLFKQNGINAKKININDYYDDRYEELNSELNIYYISENNDEKKKIDSIYKLISNIDTIDFQTESIKLSGLLDNYSISTITGGFKLQIKFTNVELALV